MRRLWLDYQREEPGRHRAGALVLLCAVMVTAALAAQQLAVVRAIDDLQPQVARLKRDAARLRMFAAADSRAPSSPGKDGVAHATASWESVFLALEGAADESVTLLGLQPGATEIQIAGEAKHLAAAMDYLSRLQGAAAFSNIHLTQSEIVTEHPQHPIRFGLAAQWRGASR